MSAGADDWDRGHAADVIKHRSSDLDCEPMVSVHGTPLEGGCGEAWIRGWYEVVRRLEASWGCDAELVVFSEPIDEPSGTTWYGAYHVGKNVLSVAVTPSPWDSLATILHEVAHFAANPRHRRHHGYSWRRCYAEIVKELAGIDILPLASKYRRDCRTHGTTNVSRTSALDVVVTRLLTEARPKILIRPGLVSAVIRGKRHRVAVRSLAVTAKRSPPQSW